MMEGLATIETFAGRTNESFELQLGESGIEMTLMEVKPLAAHPFPGMLRAPFSLLFNSQSAVVLPQRIYRMRNATLGAVEIFLVPVARNQQGIVYQAVFN